MKSQNQENSQIQNLNTEKSYDISLGTRLKNAREHLKLSTIEVAEKLRLTSPIIEYLESGQYQSSNKDVFYRGYLRAYTKLLNLPSDDLVAEYNNIIKHDGIKISDDCELVFHLEEKHSTLTKSVRWLSLGLLVSLVIIIGTWWHTQPRLQGLGKLNTQLPIEHATNTVQLKIESTNTAAGVTQSNALPAHSKEIHRTKEF